MQFLQYRWENNDDEQKKKEKKTHKRLRKKIK